MSMWISSYIFPRMTREHFEGCHHGVGTLSFWLGGPEQRGGDEEDYLGIWFSSVCREFWKREACVVPSSFYYFRSKVRLIGNDLIPNVGHGKAGSPWFLLCLANQGLELLVLTPHPSPPFLTFPSSFSLPPLPIPSMFLEKGCQRDGLLSFHNIGDYFWYLVFHRCSLNGHISPLHFGREVLGFVTDLPWVKLGLGFLVWGLNNKSQSTCVNALCQKVVSVIHMAWLMTWLKAVT